jgi:hypothetical protein
VWPVSGSYPRVVIRTLVCNFPESKPDAPALLEHSDVTTCSEVGIPDESDGRKSKWVRIKGNDK